MRVRSLCAAMLALVCSTPVMQAKTYDYVPTARGGSNYLEAGFRCWIPDSDETLRGVLVVLAGQNSDGRDYTGDKTLRSKCQEWNFALVGCYFKGDADHYYSEARRGSGLALQNALRDFSDQTGKRELNNAPMVLMGFSTGAQFAFGMTCFKSNDVIAFVADKGAFYTSRPDAGTFRTPGLFIVGEKDQDTKSIENTRKMFLRGKERRALWAMHAEKRASHKPADKKVRDIMLDYLDSVIQLRTDPKAPYANPERIRSDAGFFVERQSGEITTRSNREAESSPAWSWLPDEKLAQTIIDSGRITPAGKGSRYEDDD